MPKYIDADALLREAKRLSGPHTGDGWSNWGVYALIERQPAADVEPVRHGWWIPGDHFEYDGHGETVRHPGGITCSQCRYNFAEKYLWSRSYCPHCGAKMVEEEDSGNEL